MKTTLKVIVIFVLFFSVGRLLAEQLPTHIVELAVAKKSPPTPYEELEGNALPTIGQKDKRFSLSHLTVKVGDSVKFTNNDPFIHNVFSLSPASTFDLGSYPEGESRTVTFDEAGEVRIECAIHPSMRMVVEVEE